jgi:hypothetical protein
MRKLPCSALIYAFKLSNVNQKEHLGKLASIFHASSALTLVVALHYSQDVSDGTKHSIMSPALRLLCTLS